MAYFLKNEKDEPLKHGDGVVFMAVNEGVVKGVDMNQRLLHMTGTAEVKDRDGDIVVANGVDLSNYLKNPVFLWSHTYSGPASVPLGKAIKVVKRKNPNRVDFTIQFSSMGLNPFADMVLALYNEGIINASSIGFIPREWEKLDDEEKDADMLFWRGRKFTKTELLELSGCAVPANPAALQHAIKGYAHPQASENDRKSIYQILMGEKVLDVKHSGVDELELQAELQEMSTEVEEVDDSKTSVQVPGDVTNEAEKDASQGVDNTEKNEYNVDSTETPETTEEKEDMKTEEVVENTGDSTESKTDSAPNNETETKAEDLVALVKSQGEVITVSAKEFMELLFEGFTITPKAPTEVPAEEVPEVPEEKSEETPSPEISDEDLLKLNESLKSLSQIIKGVN